MQRQWFRTDKLTLCGGYAMAFGIMWAMKLHYSTATAAELWWILNPIAAVVQVLDGSAYGWDATAGWVRSDGCIIIAPSCSGVNFFIMLFGLSVAAFLHRRQRVQQRLIWLIVALVSAYVMTICVNSLRIWIAIAFYENHLAWGWLTPERLHRAMGVVIYFGGLGVYYDLCDYILKKGDCRARNPLTRPLAWQPLAWYVTGAVAVPLLHHLFGGAALLNLEYSLTVIAVSAAMWGAAFLVLYFYKKRSLYAACCLDRGR